MFYKISEEVREKKGMKTEREEISGKKQNSGGTANEKGSEDWRSEGRGDEGRCIK